MSDVVDVSTVVVVHRRSTSPAADTNSGGQDIWVVASHDHKLGEELIQHVNFRLVGGGGLQKDGSSPFHGSKRWSNDGTGSMKWLTMSVAIKLAAVAAAFRPSRTPREGGRGWTLCMVRLDGMGREDFADSSFGYVNVSDGDLYRYRVE